MNVTSIAILQRLRDVAETLDASTGSLNTIMQFIDSYAMKADIVQHKVRMSELGDIISFASGLRGQLSSEDAAQVIVAWIGADVERRGHSKATVGRIFDTVFASVRIITGSSDVIGMIREKLSSSSSDEGKN